jgi:hypothetical protein
MINPIEESDEEEEHEDMEVSMYEPDEDEELFEDEDFK